MSVVFEDLVGIVATFVLFFYDGFPEGRFWGWGSIIGCCLGMMCKILAYCDICGCCRGEEEDVGEELAAAIERVDNAHSCCC